MENIFIYLIKASGLIGLFYFAYLLLLRKETFFNSNRWFLLTGLITSVILPLFFITKIIWVEPTTASFDWSNIPVTTPVAPEPEINWYLIITAIYCIGIIVLFIKLAFDFKSLIQLLKGKRIQKQANFKLIDIAETIAPFSYFNYIVYNSALYTATELENILKHEKVHSQQKHSIDVLISRLFCVVFWFNPIIWLYQKAIAQNLEFIADSEASKNILDKKSYQLTLLKITTTENSIALTNHFYQSLIKKRIIMLNQNPSNKQNSWKYVSVLPAIIAFVLLFQIEIVAQEKETPKQQTETKSETVDLKTFKVEEDLSKLSEEKEIYINGEKSNQEALDKLTPKEIERVDVASISGKKTILVTTKQPLKPVKITDKTIYINGVKSTEEELEKLDKNTIDKMDVNTLDNTVKITTKTIAQLEDKKLIRAISTSEGTKPLIILNGQINSSIKIEEINPDKIHSINVLKGFQATSKYGESGKNGVVEITTKEKIGKNEFQSLQGKTVQGFELKENKIVNGWKVESEPITTSSKEGVVKNDWVVGYGINGDNNSISRIIENKTINYKKAVIIIDGKQSNYKTLEKLNPNEIQSVIQADIKKAPKDDQNKAIELYGKKALNGFIQINTKGGDQIMLRK